MSKKTNMDVHFSSKSNEWETPPKYFPLTTAKNGVISEMKKFIVLELPPFYRFNDSRWVYKTGSYEEELNLFQEMKKSGEFYDGPARYLEPCEDPGFPPRKDIMYCVRLRGKAECQWWKPYDRYCWQEGKWFKCKNVEYLFTDVYVPQYISHYEFLRLQCPINFLNKKAQKDYHYYCQLEAYQNIRRDVAKFRVRTRK